MAKSDKSVQPLTVEGAAKNIVDGILSMGMAHNPITVFNDWVCMMAMAISNQSTLIHDSVWERREELYMSTARKYKETELKKISELFAFLCEALEETPSDVLGRCYMVIGSNVGALGQFFTPFHLSELTAKLAADDTEREIYTVHEPACGSGGLIIALANDLKSKGINYQKKMNVICQDLDWQCVYMCYVQLSLLGIKATVVQGSTLTEPYHGGRMPKGRVFRTPARAGCLI